MYVSSEGRGQGEELEMQEVYRWARDRGAKKGHFSNIRGLVFRYGGRRVWNVISCVCAFVCVKVWVFVCICQIRSGGRGKSSRCRRCIDEQRIAQQKRLVFRY